ncbi:MAG: hypothetical protein AAB482_04785 [Patescibacteria group bacterium]
MDEYIRFNFYEGLFWIALGLSCFVALRYVNRKYKSLACISGLLLVLFGISDFTELAIGGFLSPGQEWLFAWKIACVVGFTIMIGWYFKLRLSHS